VKVRDREYLRKTLEHTGLSYREIAARAGVSHATVANLARTDGRDGCSEASARAISSAVGADVYLLFLP
jgi:transposase